MQGHSGKEPEFAIYKLVEIRRPRSLWPNPVGSWFIASHATWYLLEIFLEIPRNNLELGELVGVSLAPKFQMDSVELKLRVPCC